MGSPVSPDNVISTGYAIGASAQEIAATSPVTEIALEALAQDPSDESYKKLFALIRQNPKISFDFLKKHLQVKARHFKFTEVNHVRYLLHSALLLKQDFKTIVSLIPTNPAISGEIFLDAVRRSPLQLLDRYIIQSLPMLVFLELDSSKLTIEDYQRIAQCGVNLSSSYLFSHSPLLEGIRKRDVDFLSFLLKSGCCISGLFNPHPAPDMVSFFKERGRINDSMQLGQQIREMIRGLIELGAQLNPKASFKDDLLLKMLMIEGLEISNGMFGFFRKHGFDLMEKRELGLNALQWAATRLSQNQSTIHVLIVNLLKYGFSPNYEGIIPFRFALEHGPDSVVQAFVDHGVDLDAVVDGASVLHTVIKGYPKVSFEHRNGRMNVFVLDSEGRAPVDIAFMHDHRSFIKNLIVQHCSVDLSKNKLTKKAIYNQLMSLLLSNHRLGELVEAAILLNIFEFSHAVIERKGVEVYFDCILKISEKYPQLNDTYLFNHYYRSARPGELEGMPSHPFEAKLMEIQCHPLELVLRTAHLIQTEPCAIDWFSCAMPKKWKNSHYLDLYNTFVELLRILDGSGVTSEVRKEAELELMNQYGITVVPGIDDPLQTIAINAFEDYKSDFVLKDGSIQAALMVLFRTNLLMECSPGMTAELYLNEEIPLKILGT